MLKNLLPFFSKKALRYSIYFLMTNHLAMIYSMGNVFQKTCTGISMAIQWSPSVIGTYGLASMAKAKYIDRQEVSSELELMAAELEPEKTSFIREILRTRGRRKFNNPDHYNEVGISLAGIFSGVHYTQERGKQGHIVFNPLSISLEQKDLMSATFNHEAGHADNNDGIKSALAYTLLPFVVECATRKIKAPLQAFRGTKNLISAGSPMAKAASQIPRALAKRAASSLVYNAYERHIEANADNEIPDDMGQLKARKNEMESNRAAILDRLAQNKYDCLLNKVVDKVHTSSLWNMLDDHPTLTARINAIDARIDTLSK